MRATFNAIASARGWVCLVLSLELFACGDLPYVAPNVCGNGVHEPGAGEECDGYARTGERCLPPDDENQCRFSCSEYVVPNTLELTKPQCPEGMACGIGGLCHSGTGTYSTWGELVAVHAQSLQLGDLDGDSRDDLLALGNPSGRWDSDPQVLFFDIEGNAEFALDPLTPLNSPKISRLTVEGPESRQHQLVGGTQFGLATLVARPTHELSSVPYPFQTNPTGDSYRMIRIHGVADQALEEQVLLHFPTGELRTAESQLVVCSWAPPFGRLLGDPVPANVIVGNDSLCDEVVLTFEGDRNVYACSVCGPDNRPRASDEQPHVIASLPEGHTVTTMPLLADLDGDDLLDLVVGDERNNAYVALGRADGTLAADAGAAPGSLWPVLAKKAPDDLSAIAESVPYPLAVGDLNGDGLSDWVLPDAVRLVTRITKDTERRCIVGDAFAANVPSGRHWDFARIANMNGDEHLDLVAGSTSASVLDFLRGTGRVYMNPTTIPTRGLVQHLITGNYDGNQIDDIALIQRSPMDPTVSTSTPYSLAIAFSTFGEGPSSIVDVARFATVSQLVSANYHTRDAIEEIGVLAESESDKTTQLTLFIGNGAQRPIASLGLWKDIENAQRTTATPIAVSVVTREKPGILTLAAADCIGPDCHVGIWYTPGTGIERLSPPAYVGPLALTQPQWTYELTARFAVGDLNACSDTTNEDAFLLVMDPANSGTDTIQGNVTLWRVTLPTSSADEPAAKQPLTLVSSTPGSLTSSSSPKLIDLDADRRRDLVVLFTDATLRQRLFILWNGASDDDDGAFRFENATPVDVGADVVNDFTVLGRQPTEHPCDATDGDTNPTEHLYVTTDSGIFEVLSDKHRGVAVSSPLKFANQTEGAIPGGQAIAVGDMTGDGLADFAVSLPWGGVRLYSEESTLP